MERYVDMAYQRDGEEPTRWSFCSLGEEKDGGPACLTNGTFYPAADFRLHSRSPLPFPSYLCMSRNHFNLEWLGERRLKNAVMVLEWVPQVANVSALPPKASELTAEQEERLQNSLSLLDVSDRGRYGLRELREALRSAEDLQLTDAELEPLLDFGGELSYEQVALHFAHRALPTACPLLIANCSFLAPHSAPLPAHCSLLCSLLFKPL